MSTAPKLVPQASRLFERHFSTAELAESLNLSEETIRCMFENEPGVLIWENPSRNPNRRRRTLRIPQSVAERVHLRLSTRGIDKRYAYRRMMSAEANKTC